MSSRWNDFNRTLIDDMRAHGGRATSGPFRGRDVLILHTTGAKSGEVRETPLAYFPENGNVVVIASKGGAPTNPAWYHNLASNPVTMVEVLGETVPVTARITSGDERDRLFAKIGAKYPGFLGYQEKTTRVIPVVVLELLKS
jgi:deazaflavin-dependent oxidoreductase (nitroreductase family)